MRPITSIGVQSLSRRAVRPAPLALADRIREALEQYPQGLSKHQIRRLFHGHVRCDRIDVALEQRMVINAASCHSPLTGGRPSTLRSASAGPRQKENEAQEENEALEADANELVTE